MERIKIPIDIRSQILHESSYQCSNPMCRTLITLDVHHIDKVSEKGTNEPENLIALCPNCHRRFHAGEIPLDSIKSWKFHLLALNEAFDKKSINYLLLLNKIGSIFLKPEGLLEFAGLIASGTVCIEEGRKQGAIEIDYHLSKAKPIMENGYIISLSSKGELLIKNWINGNQIKMDN